MQNYATLFILKKRCFHTPLPVTLPYLYPCPKIPLLAATIRQQQVKKMIVL